MTQTSIISTTFQSANTKANGAISYVEGTNKKSGTITVSYGTSGANITFSTVNDYLIFVNEVILPLTDKIHSESLAGAGFVPASSGTAGADAITD